MQLHWFHHMHSTELTDYRATVYTGNIQIQIILLHYNILRSKTEFDRSYGNPQ